MHLKDALFAIIDTETTGTDENAELLEVCAHVYGKLGTELVTSYYSLVRPTRPIPPEAMGVHHIIDEEVAEAPTPVA